MRQAGFRATGAIFTANPGGEFHGIADETPLHRASIVLRAVGCGLGEGGARPAPKVDPVFAAIERHRAAEADWNAKLRLAAENEAAHLEAADAACDFTAGSAQALLSTAPTTLAGLSTLLAYLPQTQLIRDHGLEHDELHAFLGTLNTSLASIRLEA
jgi:hypothetical protein